MILARTTRLGTHNQRTWRLHEWKSPASPASHQKELGLAPGSNPPLLSPDSSTQRIRFDSTRCNSVRSESLGGNVGQLLGRSLRPTIDAPARERTRHSAGSLRLPCCRELGHTPHRSLLSLCSFVGGCFRCLHARLFRCASWVFSLNGDLFQILHWWKHGVDLRVSSFVSFGFVHPSLPRLTDQAFLYNGSFTPPSTPRESSEYLRL
jgi:hypothetical protein